MTSSPATLKVIFPLPYYEPFDYPGGITLAGQTNGNFLSWADVGTSTAGPFVATVAGSLGISGLAPGVGNTIQFGGLGKSARFSFSAGTAVTSGTLYYSFIFRILDSIGLSPTGIFFAGFNNSIGTQTAQPSVVGTRLYIRSVADGFNLGLAKNSSLSNQWVWDDHVFTNGQPIFVVGAYTFNSGTSSDDVSTMWLDPVPSFFGSNQPPAASLTTADGSDMTANQIASFVFFQRDVTEPAAVQADELRIGTTWASVTPPAQIFTALAGLSVQSNGAFQFFYTNNSSQSVSVYASTNMIDWAAIGVPSQISPGLYQFVDPAATNFPRRFYKLRPP